MSNQTQDESADVLMHNGQQYVRIDYLTRLHAEVAELKRDAERYRWLRDPRLINECDCYEKDGYNGFILKSDTALDAAIDSARDSFGGKA